MNEKNFILVKHSCVRCTRQTRTPKCILLESPNSRSWKIFFACETFKILTFLKHHKYYKSMVIHILFSTFAKKISFLNYFTFISYFPFIFISWRFFSQCLSKIFSPKFHPFSHPFSFVASLVQLHLHTLTVFDKKPQHSRPFTQLPPLLPSALHLSLHFL